MFFFCIFADCIKGLLLIHNKSMEYSLLNKIDSPKDLKEVSVDSLPLVCDELRQYIIEQLATNPGH